MATPFLPPHPIMDMMERTRHMRKIEQSINGREVLFALWIAVSVHQEAWMNSRTIHGRISPRNVCIPFNCRINDSLNDARLYLHALPASNEPVDPRFQSVMALSGPILRRRSLPLDYLDDLESFWYVLAWVYLAIGALARSQT
ncbi:hypothetical protein NLJ89_g10064 [Agrocybe chaxingu]|uniref:Fungal-type protein kinase domain-containing protein n=1 Tax=Agrocybe chaxingu TaxID=84603 RepID=A0A9W8MPA1_9AGAR|nr:hypothetical protein NLJ89_g10064 [Agrocybe chaxingu]